MDGYSIPKIELVGSSYEVSPFVLLNRLSSLYPLQIGLKHGQLLAAQIRSQLDIYRDLFRENCRFDWAQVLKMADEFRAAIETLAPDLLEEMRGIADGVGRDVGLLDIVALNSRSEIALGQWDDGCTSLAWRLGSSGKQILAQNWDWRTSVGKNLAMVSIQQSGKPAIWMVVEVRPTRPGSPRPARSSHVPARDSWQDRLQLVLSGGVSERHPRAAHLDNASPNSPAPASSA